MPETRHIPDEEKLPNLNLEQAHNVQWKIINSLGETSRGMGRLGNTISNNATELDLKSLVQRLNRQGSFEYGGAILNALNEVQETTRNTILDMKVKTILTSNLTTISIPEKQRDTA